jgi:hypothetical protein
MEGFNDLRRWLLFRYSFIRASASGGIPFWLLVEGLSQFKKSLFLCSVATANAT